MQKAGKKRTRDTYNKTRLALFFRSYVCHSIHTYLRSKYKIDDNSTKSELNARFSSRRAIPEISRLSKTLNLNYRLLWQFIIFNKRLSLNSKLAANRRIKIYLGIEKEMTFLSLARLDKEDVINEDYERAILSPAIERIAGNDLKNISNDFLFSMKHMELRKEYTRTYYKVAHLYKLPTPGIQAFILRLITKQSYVSQH